MIAISSKRNYLITFNLRILRKYKYRLGDARIHNVLHLFRATRFYTLIPTIGNMKYLKQEYSKLHYPSSWFGNVTGGYPSHND